MDETKKVVPSADEAAVSADDFSYPVCECNNGRFAALSVDPIVSSARKRIYRGEFYMNGGGRYAAVAVVFDESDASFYGREVASLSRSAFLGCGPEVFDFAARLEHDGILAPTVVEEDAGVTLADALFSAATVPATPDHPEWARPLAEIGSVQRGTENTKIAFDLRVQLKNIHDAGFYHRDVRPANICLRRFGAAPEDIRATLIDHELVADYAGVAVPAVSESYERVLFVDLPRAVNPACSAIEPTSLVRDLGYLAAVEFECRSGQHNGSAQPTDLGGTSHVRAIFSYASDGSPVIHMIDNEDDIASLAYTLGLTPVDAEHFPDPHMLFRVQSEIRHGGFLDAHDLARIAQWSRDSVGAQADRLARDVVYERWAQLAAQQGRHLKYGDFDSQPELMRTSSVDQVRDIPNTIRLMGYRLVPASSGAAHDRIAGFSPAEIEYAAYLEHRRWMAERISAGWVYGDVRDDERRVHPDLAPYDELSEDSKEYNRQAARAMIDILDEAGLAVVR